MVPLWLGLLFVSGLSTVMILYTALGFLVIGVVKTLIEVVYLKV